MRRFSILFSLVASILWLVVACSPFAPSTLSPSSQATPSWAVVFTEPLASASPKEALSQPGSDVATITFAVDQYSLPAYEDLADAFHTAHPTIRVVVLDIDRVKGNSIGPSLPPPRP